MTSLSLVSADEFLRMPDVPGLRRELVHGVIEESPMSLRCPEHAITMTELAMYLRLWSKSQPKPWGTVPSGDIRCHLEGDVVRGIDVAYFGPEAVRTPTHYVGPPLLAIEILSPSDRVGDLFRKCRDYLDAGTPQVWHVNPYHRLVIVHRPGQVPSIFGVGQVVPGDPELPGLRIPVEDVLPEPAELPPEPDEED